MKRKIMTLCFIHESRCILLGLKKRGFGKGYWNGFGGKVENQEIIEDAAKREVSEECGLTVINLQKVGVIEFIYKINPDEIVEVHIYRTESYVGELKESDEMRPQWFYEDEIPLYNMWPDDAYWMPFLLNKQIFRGNFLFDENNLILKSDVKEVLYL